MRYYSTKKWRFFPFGRYLGPIDEFPGRYQQSYAELFRRAQPIDFGIGYRWRTHESNLLLSVRLPDDGSAGPEATSSAEPPPPPPPRPRKPRPPADVGPQPRGRILLLAVSGRQRGYGVQEPLTPRQRP